MPNINSDLISFDMLFDAEEYYQTENCPWTFFAYPTSLADDRGLPPDTGACKLLSHVQSCGIDVAIWVSAIAENTTYFACRKEDIQRLNDVLIELESSGTIEKNFCGIRSERLFARLAKGTEQRDAVNPSIDRPVL